ncbi:MAG: Ig-like domain-containing protein [Nitrospirota bacterium]
MKVSWQRVLLPIMLLLAACSGGGGNETPAPAANITTAGGTVASTDGQAQLVVPAGAAAQSMSVTLNPAPNAALPGDVVIVPGSVYQLTGNGGPLLTDATISITLPDTNQKSSAAQADMARLSKHQPNHFADCDVDGDGDIDYYDALGQDFLVAVGGFDPCIESPKIVKITPAAILALPDCAHNGLDITCTISDLSPGTFGVLFDETAPTVSVTLASNSVTAPGGVYVHARATDNKSVKRVDLIEQKIIGNSVVATTVIASTTAPDGSTPEPILSAGTTRNFASSDDNATYRYRGWAVDGNGNHAAVVALGNELDLVVNIPPTPPSDSTPPTVSLAASANTVPVGQTVTLTATASDDVGVTLVEFFKNAVKIGEDATAPYELTTAAFTGADLGAQTFTATAKDAANNNATSNSVPVTVTDTQAPSISLAASATSATVGETVTLTATSSDNLGVMLVEFFRNGGKIGEDATAPYEFTTAAFVDADIGVQSFTARATDAASNSATSSAVNVTVTTASALEAYVNPATGLDTNAGTSSAPFKTLNKAFTTVGAGGTVWLQDGSYTAATEGGLDIFAGRTVPAGVAIKAVNAGAATIGFTLQFPNGGSITGVDFDVSSQGRILASGGTTVISGPRWTKLGVSTLSNGIEASGTAKVLVDPNGVPTHNYALTPGALTGFALVTGTAELTVNGGVLDGTTGTGGAFTFDGAKLSLANFKLTNTSNAWVGGGGALYISGNVDSTVTLTNVEVNLAGALSVTCLAVDRNAAGPVLNPYVKIQDSVIANCNGGGVQLREGLPLLEVINSQITGHGRFGIEAGQIGFDSTANGYARPGVVLTNSTISGNALGGISLNNGGGVVILGGTVAGGAQKGIQLLKDSGIPENSYTLTARNAALSGSDALVLQGDAGGTEPLNLGTQSSPGGNTILGTTTGVRVSVEANVTVHAVGNTWAPNVQGADAAGHYSTASSVCAGANPCDVTSGSGTNYTFFNAGTGATLRLAHQ